MVKGTQITMVCIKCGNKQPVYENINRSVKKELVTEHYCYKCKKDTPHKNILFYEKEKRVLECNELFGKDIPSMLNLHVRCFLIDDLFCDFYTVGQAADFIILNNRAGTDTRDQIMNRIRNVLSQKEKSVYGLKFSYTYVSLYNKLCLDPVGYCKLKGCFLSLSNRSEKKCDIKQCKTLIKKEQHCTK